MLICGVTADGDRLRATLVFDRDAGSSTGKRTETFDWDLDVACCSIEARLPPSVALQHNFYSIYRTLT